MFLLFCVLYLIVNLVKSCLIKCNVMFKKCFKIGICASICHKIKYRCNSSSLVTRTSVTLDPIRLWVRRYFFLLRLDRKRHFFAASLQSRASIRRRVVEALFCGFFNYKSAFGFYLVKAAYMLQCSLKLSPIVSQSFFMRVCSPIMWSSDL